MARIALLCALVLAAGAGLFLMLRGGGGESIDAGDGRAGEVEEPVAPLEAPGLQGLPGGRRGSQSPAELEAPPAPEPPAPVPGEILLRLTVVDDATGEAIPRALVWGESAREPCPRLPDDRHLSPPPSPLASQALQPSHACDAEGRFELDTSRVARPDAQALDVFAGSPGHVIGVACAVRLPGETTLRLKRGLTLAGRVTDLQGRPLADAIVLARPGATTPPVPGHGGWASSDEQGEFKLEGLLAGALKVRVGREGFYPLDLPAEDPSDARPRTYVLTPAFVLRFRLRTNDGRAPVNPTVRLTWSTQPPKERLSILELVGDENSDGILTQGVAIPATTPTVRIEFKAEGYATWVRAEEPVPPEGGERTIPITLGRDTTQGGLRLVLENERGERQSYAALDGLSPLITPLDRQDLQAGVLSEHGEDLRFPSLPLGRYRILLRAHAHAPLTAEALVVGGTETEVRLRLAPPARLRVRFTAAETRIVRFQLLRDGMPVAALPEPGSTAAHEPGKPEGLPTLAAGEGGVLLGGLTSGTYVVEVLNDDLEHTRTSVTLREGQTEELEIRVMSR